MKSKSLKKKAISMLLCFMVVFAYSAGFNDLFLVNAEGNTVSDSENGVTVTPDHTSGEPSEENKPGMELSGDDTENREPIVISSWKWVDDSEILTYDKKAKIWWVSPTADEENPVTAELLKEYLPKSIEAVLADGTEKSVEITWDFGEIGDGVTAGEYTFTASLPEGYALTDDVEALVAVVRIDSSALLDASYSAGGLTITADDGQELTSGTTNDSEVYLSGNVIYITNTSTVVAGSCIDNTTVDNNTAAIQQTTSAAIIAASNTSARATASAILICVYHNIAAIYGNFTAVFSIITTDTSSTSTAIHSEGARIFAVHQPCRIIFLCRLSVYGTILRQSAAIDRNWVFDTVINGKRCSIRNMNTCIVSPS